MNAKTERAGVKIGCCGFPVARRKYFAAFDVVEVQQSFYNLPQVHTAERWKREAPLGFEFTAKAWQLITHEPTSPTYRRLKHKIDEKKVDRFGSFKPTAEVAEAWGKFLTFARTLAVEKVIFQCPASFRPTPENKANMMRFFSSIDREGLLCIWEPRGDWTPRDIVEVCEKCRLVHCTDPFHSLPQTVSLQYYRLHGVTGYRYRFSDADLDNLLERIESGRVDYFMFNNMTMFEDARRFKRAVGHAPRSAR